MRMLKARVFQRDSNIPIDEEQCVNPELRPERLGQPDAILLPLVNHVKADARQIRTQQRPHREGNAPRRL